MVKSTLQYCEKDKPVPPTLLYISVDRFGLYHIAEISIIDRSRPTNPMDIVDVIYVYTVTPTVSARRGEIHPLISPTDRVKFARKQGAERLILPTKRVSMRR